jgi:hypothetical protein
LDREDVAREEFCHLSLSALSGTDDADSMRVRALSKKQVILILVDSGSSSTFISTAMVARIGLKPISVRVANEDMLISDTYVPKVQWWANGHTYKTDMRVLDLSTFDAVLGYDWLRSHSPMKCDWEHKTLEFADQGVSVKLCGDGSSMDTELLEISVI